MRIGVLGTGSVGQAIAGRSIEVGHDVVMGSRSAANEKARAWAAASGGRCGTFADAAAGADVVVNVTPGAVSLEVLAAAGAGDFAGTVILDVANPLNFGAGAPSLTVVNTDSLGEQIQRTFPSARVVKGLNTMTAEVMVHPERLPGPHHTFVAGDDDAAKATVTGLLREFGWPADAILDLGGIEAARGLEMFLPLWLSLWQAQGTMQFNIQVVRAP